jgi:hypothetical protein
LRRRSNAFARSGGGERGAPEELKGYPNAGARGGKALDVVTRRREEGLLMPWRAILRGVRAGCAVAVPILLVILQISAGALRDPIAWAFVTLMVVVCGAAAIDGWRETRTRSEKKE